MYNRAAQTDFIFSTQSQPDFAHNDLLQLMTETSIVGFILYAGLFVIIFWRSLSAFHTTKDIALKLRLICGMASIVAFMMNSLFTFPIRMAIPPLFLMVILGLLVSLDLLTMKETGRYVIPMNNYSCYTLIAVFCLFAISLTAFNFRMVLADRHYLKSRYFNRIKDWQLAKTEAQKAISYIPWRHMLWFELGRATDYLGSEDIAIEAYKQALKIHPNHLNSLLNLGYEYLKKNDYGKAIPPTRRALEIMPDLDKALFNMGKINEGKNQIKEAALNYQRSIKANPTYADAYFRLGLISLKENRLIEARQQFEKARELKPGVAGVHFYLGLIYGRMNENQMAVAEFKKEIEINPRSDEAFNNLGLISAKEEKWNEAVSIYKKAIDINPNLGAAQLNIAIAYYMIGDYSSSWKHSRIGENLGLPQAKILIQRLKMVSKEPDY
jgi:tetratricopeptide (TPR) repeat protein